MADVFLSYKVEDHDLVVRLVRALEKEGVSVWWDRKISAGGTWRETITNALTEAKVVVVAWSKRTEDSGAAAWVFNEVDEAQRMKKPLIPVSVEACNIPLGYRHVQAADLSKWRGEADHPEFQDVLQGVRAAIAGRPVGGVSARSASASRAPASSGGPSGGLGGKVGFGIGLAFLIGLAGAGAYFWKNLGPPPAQQAASTAPADTLALDEQKIRSEVAAEFAARAEAEKAAAASTQPAQTAAPVQPAAWRRPQIVHFLDGNKNVVGLRRDSGTIWHEYTADGKDSFEFMLQSETPDQLVLVDKSRDMTLRADFKANMIFWRQGNGPENPLYPISSVER